MNTNLHHFFPYNPCFLINELRFLISMPISQITEEVDPQLDQRASSTSLNQGRGKTGDRESVFPTASDLVILLPIQRHQVG